MKLTSLMLMAVLAAAAGARAQTAPSSDDVHSARKACRSDAMKVCPGKRGSEARLCLESNSEKISTDCKDALARLPSPAPKS